MSRESTPKSSLNRASGVICSCEMLSVSIKSLSNFSLNFSIVNCFNDDVLPNL
jgi:hypothetical protein